MRWLLFQMRTLGCLSVSQGCGCTWCDSLDPRICSGQDHCTWSWKFCSHKSTWLREQVGAKISPLCTLLSLVPGVEVERWESRYTEEREPFSNFLRGRSVFWGFLLVIWMSWVTNIEQSHFCSAGSVLTVGPRTKRHSRYTDCRTLSLMLAQRDLWEGLVLAYHGKENRTRAEDP